MPKTYRPWVWTYVLLTAIVQAASSAQAAGDVARPLSLADAEGATWAESVQRLREPCDRHRIPLQPVADALAAVDPARQQVVAALVAAHLDTVAGHQPLLTHTVPLLVHRVARMGKDASHIIALADHLQAVGLHAARWDHGSTSLVAQLLRLPDERRSQVLRILQATRLEGSGTDVGLALAPLDKLGGDDLRELERRLVGRTRSHRRPGRSLEQLGELACALRGEQRWRGGPSSLAWQAKTATQAPRPQFAMGGAANLFGHPDQFLPAGGQDGGFSESAREALKVLERQATDAARNPAPWVARLAEAIDRRWPAGPMHAAQLGRQALKAAGDRAAEVVNELVAFGQLSKMAQLRLDLQPLSGEQVLAIIWSTIEQGEVAGDDATFLDAATVLGLRAMWRRSFLDSLEQAVVAPFDPYATVEHLLSELPASLRSDRNADRRALVDSCDDHRVFAAMEDRLAARSPQHWLAIAGPPPASRGENGWRAQAYLGSCLAQAQLAWPAADHPARQRFLARCDDRADAIRADGWPQSQPASSAAQESGR